MRFRKGIFALPSRAALWRWSFVLGVLLLLEGLLSLGWIKPFLFSKPSAIILLMIDELRSGDLLPMVVTTAYELAFSFLLAAVSGLVFGYLLWKMGIVGDACEALLGALFGSPTILLYPIALVLFGRNTWPVIFMSAALGFIPISIHTKVVLKGVQHLYLRVGRSFRLTRSQMIRKILVPAALPTIFSGLKLGFTYCLISVTAMEYLVELGGVGKLVSQAYFRFQTVAMFMGMAVIVVLAVFFNYLMGKVERQIQ